jgi:hypothetical protein
MNVGASALKVAMLGSWVVLMAGGCVFQTAAPPKDAPRVVAADGSEVITSAELDELTRAFADRYVGLLYSACEMVKADNPDPLQRRDAQVLLLDGAGNIYDIASNADAFTRLLDMVVVTSLMSQVWVDDGRAEQIFGNRAEPLADAMLHARKETLALAARVLTTEQLGVLDSLLLEWRRDNPAMVRTSFVRFSNFAIGRGRTAASEVLAARGFFAEVGQAGKAVDEARFLAERMFYQLKRAPTLLRWHLAAAKDDLLATPEVVSALADMHRLTDQAERLPAYVAAERETVLAAIDSRIAGADATLANVKDAIAEAKSLVASLERASESLDRLLSAADVLFARWDAWHRWTVTNRARPFDIREYIEMAKESATATQRLNELLESSNGLLTSPDWRVRMDEWSRTADGRIELVAGQSRLLLDNLFRLVCLALGVLFALLVCYRVISILLMRRFATPGTRPGSPPSGQARGRAQG